MTYPLIEKTASTLTARLSPGRIVRTTPVWCVVDFSGLDEPLGIEIIGFKEQLGHEPPPSPGDLGKESGNEDPVWIYSSKGDAFYLRLKKDRAPKQKEILGAGALDRDGCVVSLQVDLAE